jgi:hypothetical protein
MKQSEMKCSTCIYGDGGTTHTIICKLYPTKAFKDVTDWCGQGIWQTGWDKFNKVRDTRCWGEWEKEEE